MGSTIDLNATGNLVAITIEHPDLQAKLPDLFYEQMGKPEVQSLRMNRQNPPRNIYSVNRHLSHF